MALFGWGRAKPEDRQAIALDIGTEFVKALIFIVNDEGAAEVVGVGRQRQRLSDMQGGTVTDIHGVIGNCEAALERAAEQAGFLPEQVIMGIAGELVKGATTTIKYVRPEPLDKISAEELHEILEKVQRRAHERARAMLAWETGHSEIDVRLVNAAIVDVRIDGYKVTNPLGFQGREVMVGIYSAFAPIVHLGALQTIAEELDLDLLSVAAEPYAVARVTGPNESSEFSAIFIDIGGGTTDIAIVNNGGLVGTKMFAIGGRAFTKRIMNSFSLSFQAAEEKKINYSEKRLDRDEKAEVKKALETDLDVWLSGMELTLGEFKNIDLLPSRILLCGGGSNLPDIERTLKGANWGKRLPFARKPAVHFLVPSEIPNVIDTTKKLTTIQDITPMALANLAIDLVGRAKAGDVVVSRVVKSLKS
ncbi:rod shape-determining protein [Candidatus Berkelbacteria bacterium]|nr:rod shape-determining protein [Candidatus Berkelbacteria bacterium]